MLTVYMWGEFLLSIEENDKLIAITLAVIKIEITETYLVTATVTKVSKKIGVGKVKIPRNTFTIIVKLTITTTEKSKINSIEK